MNIADTVRLYGGPAAIAWLQLVKNRMYGHGSELVDALGFKADNVHAAKRILEACVAAKALIRCRYAPTRSQQFFGSGGSLELDPEEASQCYHYAPGPEL